MKKVGTKLFYALIAFVFLPFVTTGTANADCLFFNGIDSYVEIPDAPRLSGGPGRSLTVEAWVLPGYSRYSGGGVITKYANWNNKDWGLSTSEVGFVGFQKETWSIPGSARGNWWVWSEEPIPFNEWSHAAFVFDYDNELVSVYIDGTLQGSRELHSYLPDTAAPVWIGGPGPFYYNRRSGVFYGMFSGYINEMRVWDIARTEDEIYNNMTVGSVTGSEEGLVAYWDFEQGQDLSILYDRTGNSNHGMIHDAQWSEYPGAITDLSASPVTADNKVKLEWTSPENTNNKACIYIVKYNTVPITESNWDESFDVDGEPTPRSAGSSESMSVTIPYPDVNYHFAIKTLPNTSDISNSPSSGTPIQLRAGWNLVAFVPLMTMPIEDAMLSLQGKYTSIWSHDADTNSWLQFIVGGPDFLNNLDEMRPGYGYWIHVTEDCIWDFGGGSDLSPPGLAMRRPPFVLYGKVTGDMETGNNFNVSVKVGEIEAGSYVLGLVPDYEDYYVLEIPVNGPFHEGDAARIYADGTLADPITLGGIGIIKRHDIYYKRIPKVTKLFQNYPNPFNPETWIPYQLAEDSEVTIRIYNVSGQRIRLLNLGYKEAGSYITKDTAAHWDGRTDTGDPVSSGIYFYSIQAGDYSATRKMIVAR